MRRRPARFHALLESTSSPLVALSLPGWHLVTALAMLYREGDWAGGEAAYRRAFELDLNAHYAHYAAYLIAAARYTESITSYQREIELQTFSPIPKAFLGIAYVCAGQPDRAIQHLRVASSSSPTTHQRRLYWVART